jgi:ribulose-phosphate 3-epimerase
VKAGANILTLHIEALRDPKSALQKIRTLGAKPGLTLRPSTPLTAIEPYLSLVDLVLVMTVEPGWGGQAFMTEQTQKITTLQKWASKNNPDLWIEVDGGITDKTAALAISAGANVLVAGSFIFRAPQKNYSEAIGALRAHS